jgi:hypothetical protein
MTTSLAIQISQRFRTPTVPLEREYAVTGFDGKQSVPLTHVIILTMATDNRIIRRMPFLILDLGRHNIILGRMWLAEHRVLVDCAGKRLIWSSPPAYQDEIAIQMNREVPRNFLIRQPINRDHQCDVVHRARRWAGYKRDIFPPSAPSSLLSPTTPGPVVLPGAATEPSNTHGSTGEPQGHGARLWRPFFRTI